MKTVKVKCVIRNFYYSFQFYEYTYIKYRIELCYVSVLLYSGLIHKVFLTEWLFNRKLGSKTQHSGQHTPLHIWEVTGLGSEPSHYDLFFSCSSSVLSVKCWSI